jgi:hypothetical protein
MSKLPEGVKMTYSVYITNDEKELEGVIRCTTSHYFELNADLPLRAILLLFKDKAELTDIDGWRLMTEQEVIEYKKDNNE